jgi:class 3 adenylate cyclase
MFWLRPRFAALFLAAIAAISLSASLAPETGAFVFQNYSPKTYGANPQNWAIAQDSRGVMYFGNNEGVLEFDGVSWRLIKLSYSSAARSLAVDALGRIYVGGLGVFGYLQPDPHGSTRFVLIEPPKEDRDFLDVWNVVPTAGGVYFSTDYRIFFLSNSGQLKVLKAKKRFGRIFSAYGELFASTLDSGLRRLKNDDFIAGPAGDSLLASARVAFAPGEYPLLAGRQGVFNFTLSEITPFANSAADYLRQNEIWAIKQLSNGSVAVGTRHGGLVLLNRQGGLERVIRKENGLLSDWVTAIYEDRQHAVWIATDSGLMRFDMGLSTFGESQGIRGSVISEARAGVALYAGTTSGLFRMQAQPGTEPSFEEIKDLHEQIVVLAEHDGELFAGGDPGLYRVVGTQATRFPGSDGVFWDIAFSRRDSGVFYTAGVGGVRKWRRDGQTWKSTEPTGVRGQDFRTVVEDADATVWSTTGVSIWHVDFSQKEPRRQQFTSSEGIPAGVKNAYLFRNHVVFATENGLLRFSEKTQRFQPDDELGAEYGTGHKPVSLVREDFAGNVWITGHGYHDLLLPQADGTFRKFSSPLIQTGVHELWTIFFDPDGTSWASDPSGPLIRFEKPNTKGLFQNPSMLLRGVSIIGQKSVLFGGDAAVPPPISLEHRDNGLRFEFASPFYEAPTALEYQFQLEGNEKKWSPWTAETQKDYTNLFEGAYRFHVRVRDPHGAESGEAVFPFWVLPPFYRTWWAYAVYLFLFLFAGWLILRWRLDALQAKNRWLEGVVEERTTEVRKERDQNEALLLNILPRPVAAELRINGAVKPTTFEDATVCFSDFVGFTLSSEKLPAETLINALNEYFTAFDDIIGRYGLEKLKTIGDAYMFAGGLPNLRPSHAVDAVLAALEMTAVVQRLTRPDQGVNWQIRLGLYSGPVVSGVVGVRKFAFDIWGNTVNFAARMESAGKPGRVNLSETTFQRVERFFECEARGPVLIKEGREMEMYFALGPKLDLIQGSVNDAVPDAFRTEYEKAFGEPPRSFPSSSVLHELLGSTLVGPVDSTGPSDFK